MLKLRSWIYNIIIYMNAAVLLLMFILLVIQVFYRKWLNDPLTWSEEIAILTMVWITFVGAYQCTAEDSHLKMSFLEDLLPNSVSSFLNVITKIIIIVFLILIVVNGMPLLEMSVSRFLPITKLSMLVPYLIIWISILLMLIELVMQIITIIKDMIVKNGTHTSSGGKNK